MQLTLFKKALFMMIFGCFMQTCQSKTIIFDIFGVLFEIPKKDQYFKIMGTLPLQYMLLDRKNPTTFKDLFLSILDSVTVDPELMDYYTNNNRGAMAGPDHTMSAVMFLWQAQKIDYKQALALVLAKIEELDRAHFFCSSREKEMALRAAQVAFDLETRKKFYAPIPAGIEILRRCAAQTDELGRKKHTIVILSNMDLEMMHHLESTYPDIFALVDARVCSGQCGYLKPDERIYLDAVKDAGAECKDSYFIDDQSENTQAADALGITALLCKDFNAVSTQLEKLGLITEQAKSFYQHAYEHKYALTGFALSGILLYSLYTYS